LAGEEFGKTNGRFGLIKQRHLTRGMDTRTTTGWEPTIPRWHAGTLGQTEYTAWLSLLSKVKGKYAANRNRMLQLVNAFAGDTDTNKIS